MFSVLVGRGEKKGPVVVWKPHSNSAQRDVHSLATTEGFLLTGGRGEVRAWGWEEINQGNVGQPQWALQVPGGGEVNSMSKKYAYIQFGIILEAFCQHKCTQKKHFREEKRTSVYIPFPHFLGTLHFNCMAWGGSKAIYTKKQFYVKC